VAVEGEVVERPDDPEAGIGGTEGRSEAALVLSVDDRLAGPQVRLVGGTLVVLVALFGEGAVKERLERAPSTS
jgi:hypothetical protein